MELDTNILQNPNWNFENFKQKSKFWSNFQNFFNDLLYKCSKFIIENVYSKSLIFFWKFDKIMIFFENFENIKISIKDFAKHCYTFIFCLRDLVVYNTFSIFMCH